jgi:hypothetical protein
VVLRYLRLFDRQVAAGRIVRHDHFSAAPPSCRCNSIHHILFALPGEEWRIPAMLELVLADTKWTAAHERKQGALLGYADWMNAWWVEHVFGR